MPESSAAELVKQIPQFIIPPDKIQTLGNPPPKEPAPAPVAEPTKTPPAPAAKPADAATPDSEPETLPPSDADAGKETLGKDPESADDPVRKMQRRIDRATRRAAEAQARAELAEARARDIEQRNAPKVPDAAPKMEDYTDITEYAKAYAKFESGNAIKEYEKGQREQANRKALENLNADWSKKSERGADKYDDFLEVVGDLKPVTPLAISVMEEENGEEIAYHLSKHMAEARRISALSPLAQAREIGKLSVKLAATKAAPPKPSKAPTPISPVSGAASTSEQDLTAPMEPKDYMKLGHKMFRERR